MKKKRKKRKVTSPVKKAYKNTYVKNAGGIIAFYNKSWLDLFSLTGVLLHTSAFWISSEKMIRRVSLLGSPFWFVYNLLSRAYGSAIGDILTICSIIIAMMRHKNSDNEKACMQKGKNNV